MGGPWRGTVVRLALVPHSVADGIVWPAMPSDEAAAMLAILHQLTQSQWWPRALLERHQHRQLLKLVDHAYRTVPFYRRRLSAAGYDAERGMTPETWRRIPLLTRRDVRDAGTSLVSTCLPPGHGPTVAITTSGSTGVPVRVIKTALADRFWSAVTMREGLWHRRALESTHCVVRGIPDAAAHPAGTMYRDLCEPVASIYPTGRLAMLDIHAPVARQVEWLVQHDPDYLLTFPSNALLLAEHFKRHRLRLPRLKSVRTLSEVVGDRTRRACREAWGVEIVDMYSAAEVGYIALQCPERPHYHVQSELVLVEVLDSEGHACETGETGAVVVTVLHNFAMPLIRYEIGDYAELGERCVCGRGAPVIRRILGRAKDALTLPSGIKSHAWLGTDAIAAIDAVVQHQVVQRSLEDLEVRLVVRRPLTPLEETTIGRSLCANLGYDFRVAFQYFEQIPRATSGKFYEFLSEITV